MSSVSAQDEKWKLLAPQISLTLVSSDLQTTRIKKCWLVFTTFIYWSEYKHGNNINWIHSQSLLDLFAPLLYWVGKYQKMGNFKGAKMVEKLVPKLGKSKGTKVSSRLNFPWNDDQGLSQYIQWTANFVTIFLFFNIDILCHLGT